MEKVKQHVGCLCCPGAEEVLPLDTVLYFGFGGWMISMDGELFFMEDSRDYETSKKLSDVEEMISKVDGKHEFIARLDLPLRSAKYLRSDCGKWNLVETGIGFA